MKRGPKPRVTKPKQRKVKSAVEPKMERGGRSMNTRTIEPPKEKKRKRGGGGMMDGY